MPLLRAFDRFFKHDASGGILLMVSAVLAMIVANSALNPYYESFLGSYLKITINDVGLSKPLILWINDGLMAVFFFLIGLELKRELLEGKLKSASDIALPGMAALGGMLIPAAIYASLNWGNPDTLGGWAIPAATDIAFALGILALVGKRAPASLKIFLLTLAILDDLGAILIIAAFYTSELQVDYLVMALLPLAAMFWLHKRKVHRIAPILLLGVVLWVLVLKSGVHATIAGVLAAFFIPIQDKYGKSPLLSLEHALAPYALYLIVPVFAFANAGVVLAGMVPSDMFQPLPMGVSLGLFLGKQAGVLGAVYFMVKFGFAQLPHGANWRHIYGVACLAGIGFTMSLFIGSLSFSDPDLQNQMRLGVMIGSIFSAVVGFTILRWFSGSEPDQA
ncbi:MAG TPA: Na+/H+ antiporter NhaA [Aliiroseovarius sp.]|nr:Na+/H+ antiporter NhaA [Aliiroseovarius sp.]